MSIRSTTSPALTTPFERVTPYPSPDPADTAGTEPVNRRERRRQETIHRIQQCAIDLFDRHGFDRVTIEQVAVAADVSPSTVYRHFGTKEGLVLRDEHDMLAMSETAAHLRHHGLIDALRLAVGTVAGDHFEHDLELTVRRTRYYVEVPSVRAATAVLVNETAAELARAMADAGSPLDAVERHAQATAVIWALTAALEQWWLAGADEPLIRLIDRALNALRFDR